MGDALKRLPIGGSIAVLVILSIAAMAVFAPWIAPFGESQIVGDIWESPSTDYVLGTDSLGRDMLSRLVFGARNTCGIAILATLFAFLFGVSSGFVSILSGPLIDGLVGRLFDIILSAPILIIALFCLTIFGTGPLILILVIGVTEGARIFRVARAIAMDIHLKEFVMVARLRGEGSLYLMRRELLPNAAVPLFAEFGLRFCFVLLFISTLSFLGLGLQPPTADWGSMVRDNADAISFGILTPLIPAVAIAALTISINVIVDAFVAQLGDAHHET